MKSKSECDFLVVGGGFYGCCLALFLRSISSRVVLAEAGGQLMDRASRVNQARVHTGFHYPRSVLTAVKSMVLHRRFAARFPDAIVDDFQMLYAIARRRSLVSAKRFHRMFTEMGAPIAAATPSQAALLAPDTIEASFACTEHAFDYSVLRDQMVTQLDEMGIDVRLNTELVDLEDGENGAHATLSDGAGVTARFVFNVTYSQINRVLEVARLPVADLKHELAEIALVRPPSELQGYGITVMDGPFLSTMPYPSERLYSLTHVRYTPHCSWTDTGQPGGIRFRGMPPQVESRHRQMLLDGSRYIPCLGSAQWVRSLYEIKTVLMKNEQDDGRPILYQRRPPTSRVMSILGGKIDNVFDLFDLVKSTEPAFAGATDTFVYRAFTRQKVAGR